MSSFLFLCEWSVVPDEDSGLMYSKVRWNWLEFYGENSFIEMSNCWFFSLQDKNLADVLVIILLLPFLFLAVCENNPIILQKKNITPELILIYHHVQQQLNKTEGWRNLELDDANLNKEYRAGHNGEERLACFGIARPPTRAFGVCLWFAL